jgi:ankyrin repeat protein
MDTIKHTLPSLLAIAAQHDDVVWISFLLAEGVSAVDSVALLRAIQTKASVVTIRLLLETAKVRKSLAEQTYGVAALRQAVRSRNFTLINILCKSVDMNAIEPFPEEFRDLSKLRYDVVNPLGEAIITNDLEIVRILLCHGASPNAFVTLDGLKISEETQGYMQRVTPLLAAIEMKSLPMVKVLLEHGAELHYTRNMGIIRTPLQRAAETGCFDIVQYLIDQNASIDTIPVHTGATALQLAAMHGLCGIAEFLLKHRADPNHPPSRGNGRTAFEAAAEQSRIDMMSLLMQCGVNLDLEFGTPPESQYERARRFAEKKGFPASKRFVEHLYRQKLEHQSWDDLLVLDSP